MTEINDDLKKMKSDLCLGSLFRFGIKPICITYTDTDRILIVFTKQIKSPRELKRKSKAHLLLSLISPYPQLSQLKDLLNMGNTYCHCSIIVNMVNIQKNFFF